jgi:hypothetical protein
MNSALTIAIGASALGAAVFLLGGQVAFAASADPCSLATSGEVGAALGTTVNAGKPLNEKSCQWREQTKPGEAAIIVDVSINSVTFYNTMKSTPGTGTHKPVSGLGDEAFFALWNPGNQVNESLWVKKGDAAFNVVIRGSKPINDADRETKERTIASNVLKKII